MMRELAARVQRIKTSPTLAVSARADELIMAGKDIINLSVGEPDFDTPDFIKEAAIKAIRDGMTKYTAVDGTSGLKNAIINKFERDNQLRYEPAQILVSCGAKHSFYNLFAALLNPNDEVVMQAPYWVSYPDMVKLMDAQPVIVKTTLENHFKITPAQLESAITPKTKLVILNSPSNPTGVAYSADELSALANVLLNHPHVMIATDDIYETTVWKGKFTNILMVCKELYERCIIVNGVSKAYAMTGWRIGYAAGPAQLIAAMKKIQSQSTSNPTSIAQAASEAALNGDQSFTAIMTNAYKERHDYIIASFREMPGIQVQQSDGTFYSFPSLMEIIEQSHHVQNDIDIADYFLTHAGIALIPGSAFGTPGHVRISYATQMERIREAMQRMKATIEDLLK